MLGDGVDGRVGGIPAEFALRMRENSIRVTSSTPVKSSKIVKGEGDLPVKQGYHENITRIYFESILEEMTGQANPVI